MKDKIINILQAETWNVTNQAGDLCTVIEEEDFNDIAERIVKLFNIPSVSQQSELFKSFLEKVVEEIEMNCGDLPWELQDEAKELLKLLNCG